MDGLLVHREDVPLLLRHAGGHGERYRADVLTLRGRPRGVEGRPRWCPLHDVRARP